MDRKEIEASLNLIRETMESATRYRLVPPEGHVAAGILGVIAPLLTFWWLGAEKLARPAELGGWDVAVLTTLWLSVLAAAAWLSYRFNLARARRLQVSAWSSLARRMYLAQVPQVVVAGALSIALAAHHLFILIPAVWLLSYGLIIFAFSYFTGRDHYYQALLFLVFGLGALLASATGALVLLGAGFGGVNLVFGIGAWVRERS